MAPLNLMREANLIAESQLTYELSTKTTASFFGVGHENLISGMQQLIKERKFAVYVSEPYTFLAGCIKERVYLANTHPVSATFGGTNTPLLVS